MDDMNNRKRIGSVGRALFRVVYNDCRLFVSFLTFSTSFYSNVSLIHQPSFKKKNFKGKNQAMLIAHTNM